MADPQKSEGKPLWKVAGGRLHDSQRLGCLVTPQSVEINQASTITVIYLLSFSTLPAIISVSIHTYSFCSPLTTAFSLSSNSGVSWPCYLMTSACLPPFGIFSISSVLTNDFLPPVSPVWVPKPTENWLSLLRSVCSTFGAGKNKEGIMYEKV